MTRMARFELWAIAAILLVACAAPEGSAGARPGGAQDSGQRGPKRIALAITTEPPALHYNLIPSPIRAQPGSIQEIVHQGLSVFDNGGALRPVLAEAVPSVENGLWKLLPDGRMEMTWTLKDGATWHDGAQVTSGDLELTVAVLQDRELALFRDKYSDAIERAEAPDARTITVYWKRPVVEAATLFTHTRGLPIPKHLLGKPYAESKPTFTELAYWSAEFVGTGPFRLRDWERGSHLVLAAYESYLQGRPKLDEIEVRFITDGNTLVGNILGGSIDLTMRQALSVDQALHVRDQWREGKVHNSADGWATVYPQFVNANPPIVTNVQFRKALIQAIDRQQLADTLMAGLLPIAHSPLFPGTPEYQATEASIVRYPYDPARAVQLIEGLGYARGPDGVFRDAAGGRLSFEARASAQRDLHVKTLLPVADAWQRIGLDVETLVIPAQRATDREEQATFPAFQALRQPAGNDRLLAYHSSEARLPERNFTGNNNGRYMNPDLDRIVDRLSITITRAERLQLAAQVVQHVTDQLPVLGLFYDATPSLIHNRLKNVTLLTGHEDARQSWNAHEWDVE